MKKGKLFNIGTIFLIIVMMLTLTPLSAMAATATAIRFEKTFDMKAELGKAYRREAITTPEGATVTYSSSDTKVATVDETGRVTAVAEGKATITAKSGNVTASYEVNVVIRPTVHNQPANGYATIAEAATAWPEQLYYEKPIWGGEPLRHIGNRWLAISFDDAARVAASPHYVERYGGEQFFATAEEVIALFGGEVRPADTMFWSPADGRGEVSQITNTVNYGRWTSLSMPNTVYAYFPTRESAERGAPDAERYDFDEGKGIWVPYGGRLGVLAWRFTLGPSGGNADLWRR